MEVPSAVQQRISTALSHFRNQMRTSNQRYVARLVAEANAVPPPKRMRHFAQAIQNGGSLPSHFLTPEEVVANPPPSVQGWLDSDGTWPAKPEGEVMQYVRELRRSINEHFDQESEGDDVELPEEYLALLKECDGVWDVDFRRSGVLGINGTNCLGGYETPDGRAAYGSSFVHKNEKFMRLNTGEERAYGWEIATGWGVDGNEKASQYYLYCQRTSEGRGGPIQDQEKEWDWRLFYEDLNTNEDCLFRVFHNIPDFLRWMGDWYARDIEGNSAGSDMAPVSIVQNPPYEEGVSYGDDEDEDEDEDEDAEANEMQQFYLAEAAKRGQ